jgi:microcystin-dependent protein
MATLFRNFQGGAITDNPLTSGATTISSAAFAALPVVAGPDVMYLVLDPEATAGAPEVVKVTAHSASATSVTVVRAQQSSVARAHNAGTVWRHTATQADLESFLTNTAGAVGLANLATAVQNLLTPAGTLRTTLATTADPGWLNHNQTVAGASTSYPALWAVAPSSWKSGSNLVIPNLADVALIAAGTLSTVGQLIGSNTVTLTTTEMPQHTHTVDPPDTTITTKSTFGGSGGVMSAAGDGSSGNLNANIGQFNSGASGAGAPFSIVQRSLGVNIQIKAH